MSQVSECLCEGLAESSAAARSRPSLSISTIIQLPALWLRAYRQRRHLIDLPDYLLADIGLRPHEARSEADKPFWRIPQAWVREQSDRG